MSSYVPISKRLVLINAASSIFTRLINVAVLVWLHQYLIRRISTEEYSLYPVVMAIMVFVPLLTSVLTSGLSRYIVEAYAKGDERRVTQIVSTMIPALMGASLVLLVGGLTLAWHVDSVLTIAPHRIWDARIMLGMLMTLAAFQVPMVPLSCGLYVRQKFVALNLIQLGSDLLRIILLFAFLFGINTRIIWVVCATVIAQFSRILVTQHISRRLVPAIRFVRSEIHWRRMRELTTFGAWVFVGQVADLMRTSLNPLILNTLGTAFDVTCFHLGSLAQTQIRAVTVLATEPLQPALTAMHATESKERMRNAFFRGGRYALWAALAIAVPLIVYRNEVITLYVGSEFLPAATVMGLQLLIFPIAYGNLMLWKLAQAQARIGEVTRRIVTIQLSVLLLTLYLVGVHKMGAVGAALAGAIVMAVGQPLLLWPLGIRIAETTFGDFWRETLLPGLAPGALSAVVYAAFRSYAIPGNWLSLGLYVLVGTVFYLAIITMFCSQPYDRDMIRAVLSKLSGKPVKECA